MTLPYWPKTNSKKVLRRMLRDLDRRIAWHDVPHWLIPQSDQDREYLGMLDSIRRAVREKLKTLGRRQ